MKLGIETLIRSGWLRNRKIGLVSHLAARDSRGYSSAYLLQKDPDTHLACLFGPEHGFEGAGGAGEALASSRHDTWQLPVYSLYGRTKKPTAAMLRGIDTLVFDIQDIGARCYTYVSTLRYVLESAARHGVEVIVTDRPVPLPRTVDGPMVKPAFRSFVSLVDTPMSYGMTPGETALWLRDRYGLTVNLRIAMMTGYRRQSDPKLGRAWAPPSPAIHTWKTARCFPATVCFEGLPAIDHGRKTRLAFQVIGNRWIRGREVAEFMRCLDLPGVTFRAGKLPGTRAGASKAIRISVTQPNRFRPSLCAISLVYCLQTLYGKDRVWKNSRPDFFDKLFGTDEVRMALLDGEDGTTIATRWQTDLRTFAKGRAKHLLY